MSRPLRILLLVAVLALIGGAILLLERRSPSSESDGSAASLEDYPFDLIGIGAWINSEPISLPTLKGKVVLLDFWTYTCINCIRTLPYLKAWHAAYADDGLVIIGVHTPEFVFEQDPNNVRQATVELGITWPVALDNQRETWNFLGVRAWPTKILLDAKGNIRHRSIGEGGYAEMERNIRDLLAEAGQKGELGPLASPEEPDFSGYRGITREIYGGFGREAFSYPPYLGNGQNAGAEAREYTDSLERLDGSFYLQGLWRREEESVIHARATERYEDYIALPYVGGEVNAVIRPLSAEPFTVRVSLDGKPVPLEARGADVLWDEAAQWTYLRVQEPRMYRVIKAPQRGNHELRLAPNADTFSLHAFTFGA